MIRRLMLVLSLIGASVAVANAIEVGDVVFLSSSGVGETVNHGTS